MKKLHLITHKLWQVEELETAGWVIDHNWGFDLPQYTPDDCWWLPQAQAVRLIQETQKQGLTPVRFTAPSPNTLQTLPSEMLGRKVHTLTVEEATSSLVPWEDDLWWKLATAKHDQFAAEQRTHDQLMQLIEELQLPADTILQCSTSLPDIEFEYRAFIYKDPKTKTYVMGAGSEYLVDGVTVYDGATVTSEQADSVLGKIDEFLDYADESQSLPPAFVVDFAGTAKGVYVLEFNPAWCSGWYNSKPEGVLETIRRSFKTTKREYKQWAYMPDPVLVKKFSQNLWYNRSR